MELLRLEKPLYIKKKPLFKPDVKDVKDVKIVKNVGFGTKKEDNGDEENDDYTDTDTDTGSDSDSYEEVDDSEEKMVIKSFYDTMTFEEKTRYQEKNKLYYLAKQSYNDIYNTANARGKTKLKAVSMMGKPIQLDSNNLETLSKHKYSVSTKADGYRFMLLISNDVNKNRTLFFVDANLDFWILKKDNIIIDNITGIAQCLIDGEVYMSGFKYESTDYITRYVSKKHDEKACIFFIAFDMLYGPTCPKFEDESNDDETEPSKKKSVIGDSLVPGPSSSMVGFKATGRWPTQNRRTVLDSVFNNVKSPMFRQLRDISKIMNFTIMVSPFVDLDDVIKYSPKLKDDESFNYYEYMKNIFKQSLEHQFERNTKHESEANANANANANTKTKTRPSMIMPVIKTDGLIFTPTYMPYVYDTWAACNNKQYKWKPKSHLTIDFAITNKHKIGDDYVALVSVVQKDKKGAKGTKGAKNDDNEPLYVPKEFIYDGKQSIVKNNPNIEELLKYKKYIIVECNKKTMLLNNDKYNYFTVLKFREDKEKPNSYKTAISVLDANKLSGDIINNLVLLKNPTTVNYKKYLENVINYLNKDSIVKLFFKNNIYKLLDDKQYNNLKYMISKVKSNHDGLKELEINKKVLELETRIVFNSNCSFYLLKETIGVTTIPSTTYRYHSTINGEDARLTCLDIADQIIPYSINHKKEINKMQVREIKSYFKDIKTFNIVLSSEEEKELNIENENLIKANVKPNAINYQSRVFISNLSIFWEIEVIEYTSADSPEKAKEYYNSGPRKVKTWKDKDGPEDNGYMTRIEIEYKPLAILINFLNVYKINYEEKNIDLMIKADEILRNNIDKDHENKSEVFEERYQWYHNKINTMLDNLKNVDSDYIARDYLRVIKYIFDIYYN